MSAVLPHVRFFMGKGGVGKSTLSALTALYHADRGHTVLLASFDPAHNLGDIFQQKLGERPVPIVERLSAVEVDPEKWSREYLQEAERQFRAAYAYLTTFSLEQHFKVIRHAPGVESYALMRAFDDLYRKSNVDFLLLDMPPTALSLSFLALPQLSLLWLEQLHALRTEIQQKQKMISRLRLGRREMERDRVMENINRQTERWRERSAVFSNNAQTRYLLIENPEALSALENGRIESRLKELGFSGIDRVVNKTGNGKSGFPLVAGLYGINKMRAYIDRHKSVFDALIR